MATLALAAGGAALGSFFGPVGMQVGFAAGSMLGNALFGAGGKDQVNEGPRLEDLRVQGSRYGTPIPIVYGVMRLAGQVIWSEGIIEHVHEDTEESGKGGGGPEVTTRTYSYTASWASLLCEGEIADVRRIWFDSVLIYDLSDTASAATRSNSESWELDHLTFYSGSETQTADPVIEAVEGSGNVPAFRGTCYLVFEDVPLENYGNRIPNVTVEIARDVTVLLDWTHSAPGTPVTPPNNIWVLQDLSTRHYLGTEPATANGFFHLQRYAQESLGEFENNTLYVWRADIRRAGGNRHAYLEVTNSDNNTAQYKISLDDGSEQQFLDGSAIVSARSTTSLGGSWYRVSLTFDSGNNGFPGNFMWLVAGAVTGGSPWSPTFNYAGSTYQLEIRNPSFATTLGVPLSTQPLTEVVTDICERCGLDSADIDTCALDGDVRGYIVAQQSGRGAIENLARGYFFDGVESEGLLKFCQRGGASVATIDTENMAMGFEGSDDGHALTIIRGQELEIPRRVSVTYVQQAKLYQPGEQHAQRLITDSVAESNTDLRLAMTDIEAAQVADVMLYAAWTERTRFQFNLPIAHFKLDPGDIVTLTDGADSYTVRLVSITQESLILLRCEGVEENPALYTSNATGVGGPADDAIVGTAGDTTLVFLDMPMLKDTSDKPLLQFALSGESSAWFGARLYWSIDGGSNYSPIARTGIGGVIGTTTDTLATAPAATWDTTNDVNVGLLHADKTLESRSDLAVLNGANAAALGADGRWEIIQFATATLEGDGTYTLSRLLRGRLGTEHNRGNHTSSDTFVFLSEGLILGFAVALAQINLARKYKPVTAGQDIGDVTSSNHTYTGVNLRPFSPVHIAGTRDGSNNLTITWIRRSRFVPALLQDPILGEASEAYEVDIMSGAVVKRTISATSETAAYTAAQQTTDGFTPGDPIEVNIYQLSEAVGRGYAGNKTV